MFVGGTGVLVGTAATLVGVSVGTATLVGVSVGTITLVGVAVGGNGVSVAVGGNGVSVAVGGNGVFVGVLVGAVLLTQVGYLKVPMRVCQFWPVVS